MVTVEFIALKKRSYFLNVTSITSNKWKVWIIIIMSNRGINWNGKKNQYFIENFLYFSVWHCRCWFTAGTLNIRCFNYNILKPVMLQLKQWIEMTLWSCEKLNARFQVMMIIILMTTFSQVLALSLLQQS